MEIKDYEDKLDESEYKGLNGAVAVIACILCCAVMVVVLYFLNKIYGG